MRDNTEKRLGDEPARLGVVCRGAAGGVGAVSACVVDVLDDELEQDFVVGDSPETD